MADRLYAGLKYDEAVRKYAQTVQSVCFVRLQSVPDAEDCLQNTFVKLYTKAPYFKDEEHLKAWLLRVAVNECRKYLRDHRRETPLDSLPELPLYPNDDEPEA